MVKCKKIFHIKATHCGLSISSDCAHSADSAKWCLSSATAFSHTEKTHRVLGIHFSFSKASLVDVAFCHKIMEYFHYSCKPPPEVESSTCSVVFLSVTHFHKKLIFMIPSSIHQMTQNDQKWPKINWKWFVKDHWITSNNIEDH